MYKFYLYNENDVMMMSSRPYDTSDRAAQEADLYLSQYRGTHQLTYEVEPVVINQQQQPCAV